MMDDRISSLGIDDCQLVGHYRDARGQYSGTAERIGSKGQEDEREGIKRRE